MTPAKVCDLILRIHVVNPNTTRSMTEKAAKVAQAAVGSRAQIIAIDDADVDRHAIGRFRDPRGGDLEVFRGDRRFSPGSAGAKTHDRKSRGPKKSHSAAPKLVCQWRGLDGQIGEWQPRRGVITVPPAF